MKIAEVQQNEPDRLQSLHEYSILDSLPEAEFDDITQLASQICNTPISLVTLIDTNRQWFKSHKGLNISETPRDYAFCAHAINTPDEIMIVSDSRTDDRFSDNPLVTGYPHVIFYVGVPLVNSDGFALGTLCVIDNEPKILNQLQRDSLKALSHQVVKLFELKRLNRLLTESRAEIEKRNVELKQFAYVVSHDIKSPLNNIMSITESLKNQYTASFDDDGNELLSYLTVSSQQLKNLVDGVLSYYSGDKIISHEKTNIDLGRFFRGVTGLLDPKGEFHIIFPDNGTIVVANEIALKQIFINLITNGIKYNHKETVRIDISFLMNDTHYLFSVKDNGDGIPENRRESIFDAFVTLGTSDRFNNTGTGIGLSTVKNTINKLGGAIAVTSELGSGSEFSFTLPR